MLSHLLTLDAHAVLDLVLLPLCILACALALGLSLNKLVNRQIRRTMGEDASSWQVLLFHAIKGTPVSFCLIVGLYWIVNTVDIPTPLVKIFSYVLFSVIVLTITRIFARTLHAMVQMKMENSDQRLPKTTLLDTILNIVIYAMGILVILQYCGISIAPILTAMGVGGMAVALSLQETLANIFSGLHLILSKQLRIGDYIRLSTGETGRVTDITWRFTTIVPAGEGNMVVIPNQKIASATISNYSMPRKDIVITVPVGVAYDSDLDQVERVTLEVASSVMQQVDEAVDIPPAVRFHTFGESSIDFNVTLHSSQFDHQFLIKHEFIKALTKRYREEGIEIPYPVRTVVRADVESGAEGAGVR